MHIFTYDFFKTRKIKEIKLFRDSLISLFFGVLKNLEAKIWISTKVGKFLHFLKCWKLKIASCNFLK